MRRGAAAIGLFTLAALGAGCAGDDPDPTPIGADSQSDADETSPEPEPEPGPEPDPTPDAGALGPAIDEVPTDVTDIDEGYVQAVLDALDPLVGDAFARLAADGEVTEQALAAFGRAYTPDTAAERAQEFAGSSFLVEDTEGPVTTVRELQTVTLGCVNAVVDRDVTGMLDPPGEVRRWSVTLVPASDGAEETGVAWVMAEDYLDADEDAEPRDGCVDGEVAE